MGSIGKDTKIAYDVIDKQKKKYGTFYKTCFHVHTPESYDYRLLKEWTTEDYKRATEGDIFKICKERKVFADAVILEDLELSNEYSIFRSKKECLSFFLLANEIRINEIALVLIADHHTIQGAKKLEFAIKELNKQKVFKIYPEVVLGIEISCADRNHVVGIFESSEKNIDKIENWLEKSLISIDSGSFKTSMEVLEFFNSNQGIGYIAHIDTSDVFKDNFFSGGYRKSLFSDMVLKYVGLAHLENLEYIKQRIMSFRQKEIFFVLDNDAHDIDEIGKNHFWIKGSKREFKMIKEALNDYDISVSFKENQSAKQYIKGIYIENTEDGFLKGKNNENFCLCFSNALNCLIGGRGTGKSTLLEVLEYVLSQRCGNHGRLEFICFHGNTWVLYEYYGEEYLIQMRLPYKAFKSENILKYFERRREDDSFFRKYYFDSDRVREYALLHHLQIYKVIKFEKTIRFQTVQNKRDILKKFFDVRYSVNDLVNTASGEQINHFLYQTLFENKTISDPRKVITARTKAGLKRMLEDVKNILVRRKEEVESTINPFNEMQKNILRIIYSQDGDCGDPAFSKWIPELRQTKGWFKKYNIKNADVEQFLLVLNERLGIFEFLKIVLNEDAETAIKIVDVLDFCTQMNTRMVDEGLTELNEKNSIVFIKSLFSELITTENIKLILDYLKKYMAKVENFSLQFNVNNKEGSDGKVIFRDVKELSLGQKVVAMLSFVLGYSEYSDDYRPLIIDQPEDNLDNQYIYKNLVNQLRYLKEKRQVIIATHNATIVTNAKAELVCVMTSDNKHGWIQAIGYPDDKKIKKHIINYLEGGKESFLHKIDIYLDVIK